MHTASLMLVCFAVFDGIGHAQSVTRDDAVERAPTRSPQIVAVMPFANISERPGDDWIGFGIAETVTAGVERMGWFSVVGYDALNATRQDAASVLGHEALARDRARSLGASWVVTGGYQRLGDQLRITVRIVDVETGAVRETARLDGRFDELFALQDRIVVQIGDSLASLSGGDFSRVAAARPPAGDLTGRGTGGEVERATAPPDVASGGITIGGRLAGPASAPVAGDTGVLAGRVTVRPVRVETPPEVDGLLADAVWQDAVEQSRSDMARGAAMYERFCQRCHELPAPAERTNRQWVTIMQQMGTRANLTSQRAALVLQFLLASNGDGPGRPGTASAAVPDPGTLDPQMLTKGREIFRYAGGCSVCHGMDLAGGVGPSLADREWRTGDGSLRSIVDVIRNGIPGTAMAAYPAGISDEMAVSVGAYVWDVTQGSVP